MFTSMTVRPLQATKNRIDKNPMSNKEATIRVERLRGIRIGCFLLPY